MDWEERCPVCSRVSGDQGLIEACAQIGTLFVPSNFETGQEVRLVVVSSGNGSAPQFELAPVLISAKQETVRGFVDMTFEVMEGDTEPRVIRLTLGQPAHQWHLIHRLVLRVQVDWQSKKHFAVVPTPIYRRTVFLRLLD